MAEWKPYKLILLIIYTVRSTDFTLRGREVITQTVPRVAAYFQSIKPIVQVPSKPFSKEFESFYQMPPKLSHRRSQNQEYFWERWSFGNFPADLSLP